MTLLEILQRSCFDFPLPSVRLCGVYLLLQDDEVVYVGSTIDMESRISWHYFGKDPRVGTKQFNRVLWIELPPSQIEDYEGVLIRCLHPRLNRRSPAPRGRDHEILTALGLPLHDEDQQARAFKRARYAPHKPPSGEPRRRRTAGTGKPRRILREESRSAV